MKLELNELEAREMAQALDEHLDSLMKEIVHTEKREYRAHLTARYDRLERLSTRLHTAATTVSAPASASL